MATREAIREYLHANLVGPRSSEDEVIEGRVHLNYMMGILFAQGTGAAGMGMDEATPEGQEPGVGNGGEEQEDVDFSGLADAFNLLPSSAGFSFCIEAGTRVEITARCGRYSREDEKKGAKKWQRTQLQANLELEIQPAHAIRQDVFDGTASVRLLTRTLADGTCIGTVTLVNEQRADSKSNATLDLFQVELVCRAVNQPFAPYPAKRIVQGDETEVARVLRIGDLQPYAVGHGASVTWNNSPAGTDTIRLEFLPAEYVGRPIFDTIKVGDEAFPDIAVFDLAYLADEETPPTDLAARLDRVVDFYEAWKMHLDVKTIDDCRVRHMAEERVNAVTTAISRMRSGIELLRQDTSVQRAFQLANLSMLIQMAHASRLTKSGAPFNRGEGLIDTIDYLALRGFSWRPFQLAFLLTVLESLVNKESTFREAVDLIWFSTGGGKTEAYLLVAAFELIHRRLLHGDRGAGTAVINRYTYRFLTADQFERTARLGCALERLRRPRTGELGEQPFTIGLWVGEGLTPNTFGSAVDKFDELKDTLGTGEVANAFQLELCPDCGTRLFPSERKKDEHGEDDDSYYGFVVTGGSFSCRCPEPACEFHESLPVSMIDKDLYQHPPSFLIGTIDKFAMVAWKEEAGVFLGAKGNHEPPSLIIQDELHLISGPLGTLAGIYEAAFECVIRERSGGVPPKFIASTATISNAVEQCRRLYAKETRIFPSPGLSSKDSFFSRIDDNPVRGRLYLGVMGQGIKNAVAVYWTVAAILQAVNEIDMTDEERNAYWTLLAYHNSKRELGRTRNAVSDEISDRLKVYCPNESRRRALGEPYEVSSSAVKSVSTARAELSREHTPGSPAIDVVPCTNMISVGIDIDRLGVMFVNGQPKLTSEYIQATSRVGRRDVPGLVVTCFSATKPRDRSHYESFRHFHAIMDAFVEPTSVTPGALPATERALHAALIIAIRFAAGAAKNDDATDFDPTAARFSHTIDALRSRLLAAYEAGRMERETIDTKLTERIEDWERWLNRPNLVYKANDKNSTGLLHTYDEDERGYSAGWRTLMSMRHVDVDVNMEVS